MLKIHHMKSKTFKICHFTSVHPYRDTRIFLKQCTSLSKHFNVYLVNTNSPADLKKQNNINLININYTAKNRLQRFLITTYKVYRAAKKLNADIYHFHDPELIPYGLLLKFKGKKVIYDIHEDLPRQLLTKNYIPKLTRKLLSLIVEFFENLSAKQFSYLFTATETIEKRFKKENQYTTTINNYPIIDELCSIPIKKKNNKKFCYVGALTKERGLTEMLNVAKKANINLSIGGRFYPKTLANEIVSYKDTVTYLGFLNRKDIFELYSNSIAGLVLLHPTQNYIVSKPVKMFEYMAAGLPVITSNFNLFKDIIEKNKCGFCIDPFDINQISSCINKLIDNPKLALEMGENGRKIVLEKYNWALEEKKLLSIYKKLLL